MMNSLQGSQGPQFSRRTFLRAVSGTAAGLSLSSHHWLGSLAMAQPAGQPKLPAVVRAAFIYPPTASLRKVGYYSWPGSTFDAEGRQRQYTLRLQSIEQKLGMRISIEPQALDENESVTRFVNEIKANPPDGLLLVPFKKGHWPHVTRIVEETKVPTVVLATLGERDETAEVCQDRNGNPEPDAELRDTETIPLKESIEEYFKREVLPHIPDAWIDHDKTKVGYEIPLNRHFYRYEPPRPLEDIEGDIKKLEGEIITLLKEVTA